MSWRRIAEVLAVEANYRAQKEMESGWKINPKSALKYNLLLIIVLSFLSLLLGFASFEGREAAAGAALLLFVIEIMIGMQTMALALQVIISDGLVDPIKHLPVEDEDLRKALSLLGIYWGGLALPFAMIPAGIISSLILRDPSVLLGFALASIAAMLFSLALGYLAGSIGGKYTRNILRRVISTLIWAVAISSGFIFSFMGDMLKYAASITKSSSLAFVPPLSFMFIVENPLSLLSSALFFLISLLLLRYGTKRFWYMAIYPASAPVKLSWALSTGIKSALMKDLKIALRNPRMMGSLIVYSFVVPIALVSSFLGSISELGSLKSIFPLISMSIGGVQGLYTAYFSYIVEASGARVLYILPLSRGKLVSMKAFSLMAFNLISAVVISAGLMYFLGISTGLISISLYFAALFSSGYLNCLIYARMLPKEQANWSAETFDRVFVGILMMLETAFYMAFVIIPVAFFRAAKPTDFSPELFITVAIYLCIMLSLSLYLLRSVKDEPL